MKTKSGLCRNCYLADYHSKEENRLRKSEVTKAWARANPERNRQKALKWQKNNPERVVEIRKKTIRQVKNRFRIGKRRATVKQGKEWSINFEQFSEIIQSNCAYCLGLLPEGGIAMDRKDSSKGYHIENVVPCCAVCNKIKNNLLTYEEMKVAMEAVVKYRKEQTE